MPFLRPLVLPPKRSSRLSNKAWGDNLTLSIVVTVTSVSSRQHDGRNGLDMANPVMIELYRTTIGGTVHYRLQETVAINDPIGATLGAITITDNSADADVSFFTTVPLASQAVVYTETGELGNTPPPASIACVTHRGRLVLIDSWKRGVWFSKDCTEDPRIGPGFSETLYLGFAADKNALASLDDKLVVFGTHTIDVVHGAGPDAAGNGEWQTQAIQTDVGCVNPRSAVSTPSGVLFQSNRGIEMISRDLVVTWVGKAIEETLAAFPTITSATLVADQHEVRFTCMANNEASGIVLAWDYLHGIWFTRTYKDTADTEDESIPFVDAALIGGVYTMLTSGGQVYLETTEHSLDDGVDYVERDILLAPISPAGPMGWCRVKDLSVLGTGVSDHDMTISIARDYSTSFEQTVEFVAETSPVDIGPLTKCRITYKNQQCRATQVRIQDLTPTEGEIADGEGAIYEGLALRVTAKPTVAKTTPSEQG